MLCFAFAPSVVSRFRDDPDVIQIGALALRFQCVTLCFQSWVVMSNMMLQTIGKTVPATFLAAARQGMFFLPLILILPRLLGLIGVQSAQAAADALTLLCAVPIQLYALRRLGQE